VQQRASNEVCDFIIELFEELARSFVISIDLSAGNSDEVLKEKGFVSIFNECWMEKNLLETKCVKSLNERKSLNVIENSEGFQMNK
jgi:hypothetical protein